MLGLYQGAHLYLLHHVVRDGLRYLTDCCVGVAENRLSLYRKKSEAQEEEATDLCPARTSFRLRTTLKYLLEVVCYPIQLASARSIILQINPLNLVDHFRSWCEHDGARSLLNGLPSSLMSTALDELMDIGVSACIDYCTTGSDLELADKMVLKLFASNIASILTTPINNVGIIQRCQSSLPGLLEPVPLCDTVRQLPWRGCLYQLFMFGGIFMLYVRLMKLKGEAQAEDEHDVE